MLFVFVPYALGYETPRFVVLDAADRGFGVKDVPLHTLTLQCRSQGRTFDKFDIAHPTGMVTNTFDIVARWTDGSENRWPVKCAAGSWSLGFDQNVSTEEFIVTRRGATLRLGVYGVGVLSRWQIGARRFLPKP